MELTITRDAIDATTMPKYSLFHKITGKEIPLVLRDRSDELGDIWTPDKRFNPNNFENRLVGNTSGLREYLPGPSHYFIDGVEVSEEEFNKARLLNHR